MMARKLSHAARRASFFVFASIASLAARNAFAQTDGQSAASSDVIINPFESPQPDPQPRALPDEPQTSHRPPITYQNPFASMSKSPPVESSLRPGPVSRWRHPIIPNDESSPVKSAVLSARPADPAHASWDELPPAEDLRHREASVGNETDPTFYSQFITLPDSIRFTPKPLTQPTWITAESDASGSVQLESLPLDPALFDVPFDVSAFAQQAAALSTGAGPPHSGHVASSFAIGSSNTALAKADVPPTIVSDGVDTPAGWFEQAQHAATNANAADDLTSVIQLCERGMRGGPDGKLSTSLRRLSAWAHNRRGEFQADAGRSDDALNDFQTAISLDPSCSLAIHNRAVTLAQQNQFAAALRDFNRVIELNPGLAVAYRNRAELLSALGRMDEAIADYDQAVESLPDNAQLYRGRAYAYQRLGRFREALADINRAADISPNDAETITQRGNLAAEQGHFDQAVTDFRQALAIDPNWADAHRSLAWLQATCPNPQFHNPQQAIAAAESAAKLSPADDYLILDTLAAARASAGQFNQAVEIQQKALANAPPELASSLEQRLSLYRQGRVYRNVPAPMSVRPASHESTDDSPQNGNRGR